MCGSIEDYLVRRNCTTEDTESTEETEITEREIRKEKQFFFVSASVFSVISVPSVSSLD